MKPTNETRRGMSLIGGTICVLLTVIELGNTQQGNLTEEFHHTVKDLHQGSGEDKEI